MGGCRLWLGLANQPEPTPGCGKGVGRKSNSSCKKSGTRYQTFAVYTGARSVPEVPGFSPAPNCYTQAIFHQHVMTKTPVAVGNRLPNTQYSNRFECALLPQWGVAFCRRCRIF